MNQKIIAKIGLHQYLLNNLADADALLNILGDAIEIENTYDTHTGSFLNHYQDQDHCAEISITLSAADILSHQEASQLLKQTHTPLSTDTADTADNLHAIAANP